MYTLHFSSRSAKDLQSCPPHLKEALTKAIEGLGSNPRPPGSRKLSGLLKESYRIRIGSYRVIYDVYDREKAVLITKIGPRKSIYR